MVTAVTIMNQQNLPLPRMSAGLRVGCWATSLLCAALWGGCARLEPIAPAASSDLQVTVDSLKTAVREAQRTAGDLRTELIEQRKELADVQVARAQLQGMLRETERRLGEARQIIELQREELASARIERERLAQAARPLHSRLRQSATMVPNQGKKSQADPEVIISAAVNMRGKADVLPLPNEEESIPQSSADNADVGPVSEEPRPATVSRSEVAVVSPVRTIVIQEGDTLWRLSRRHKVNLEALRLLNGLPDHRIVSGRTLRLPEPRLHHVVPQPASIAVPAR
jgi:FOG: LysM repeat